MNTESSNSTASSEVPEGFELDCCVDESNSETNEIAGNESWSSLPPPQNFSRASKPQDAVSKRKSRMFTSHYRAQACRAVGMMISRDEAAHWTCSEEEVENSVCTVADLLIMHSL
jgi:hypothetical protein